MFFFLKSCEDILFYSSQGKLKTFLLLCRTLKQTNGFSFGSVRNVLNVLPLRTASQSFSHFHIHSETGQRRNKKFSIFYSECIIHRWSSSFSLFLESDCCQLKSFLIHLHSFSTCLIKNRPVCSLSRTMRLAASEISHSCSSRFYVLGRIYSSFFV